MQGQNHMGIDRMLTFGFSAKLRLLQAADFKKVFDSALYKVHQPAFMLLAVDHSEHPRLGLVIAKRKIRRAHERNRVKRLARESFRLHQAELPALDIVLMAKSDAQTLPNDVIQQQLSLAWRQLTKRYQKNQLIQTSEKHISTEIDHNRLKSTKPLEKNDVSKLDLAPVDLSNTITIARNSE
jgi:ribonuclease P protein component